ncbi:EAL domain-containing protein [Bacillus sp. FJAT-45037]|uniref:EAL domain-containing protein n=1 Tax=Bacillus sp. FJAT-45037 TaxID=2011007 RepID=UPI000C24FC1D|nr:EAL-associated domain-containing protein [Bacillus sp. FJAT-45037]
MDPLDVMINKKNVIPYFQAIISADKQLVVGYEVLSRFKTENGPESLDWFSQDKSIPYEFRLELEEHLQKQAIEEYLASGQQSILFFNQDIDLLLKDNGQSLLNTLEPYFSKGLKPENIVIEFIEDDMLEKVDECKHLLNYLQSIGIKIAIDNVGQSSGNLDCVAVLSPNIVKIDAGFLEDHSLPHLYREVHHSLSMLSRKIGATLLFDGISTFSQLNYAWRNGGRFYQGSYLQIPKVDFVKEDLCRDRMQKEFQHFITFERKKMEAQLILTNNLSQKIKTTLKKVSTEDTYDEMITKIAYDLKQYAFRVYICDEEGFQLSSNIVKDDQGNWNLEHEGRYKNWSWRPYFLENIVRMNVEKRGILSDLYADIERQEHIRTYSYPISNDSFAFVDIPYTYLFEQNDLL